tara:strand:- start:2959 stop:3675 length:717 start_codon:yes stop_codon:yes gene_type:complete
MAYFLGRDVAVYLTTESVTDGEAIGTLQEDGVGASVCACAATGSLDLIFADDMSATATSSHTKVAGLTGVDISIGATDEDITFIGQKGTGKVEIKKEMSVTLTRKKDDNLWDTIFNGPTKKTSLDPQPGTDQPEGARWGLGSTTAKLGDGMKNPKDVTDAGDATKVEYGYRVHVQLKAGTALGGMIMGFPNCTVNSYSASLNVDGTTEETLEFGTQQTIVYGADGNTLNTTQTLKADY